MAKTWSAKPFISYDGKDEKGVRAEVKVVTGFGEVAKITPSGKGGSMKVDFSVENTQWLPGGWVPSNSPVAKKIEEAKESNSPIHFRIETRRKQDKDRTVSLESLTTFEGESSADMARKNVYKSIAAVWFDGEEPTVSEFAVTNPAEDPVQSGNGIYVASGEPVQPPRTSGSNSPSSPSESGKFNEPGPFYNRMKIDGEYVLNPGSTTAGVAATFYGWLGEYERTADPELKDLMQFTKKEKVKIAKVMFTIANHIQIAIYNDMYGVVLEKADPALGSHTRARGLVFETIRSEFPLNSAIAGDNEKLKEWMDSVEKAALSLWKWSMKIAQELC